MPAMQMLQALLARQPRLHLAHFSTQQLYPCHAMYLLLVNIYMHVHWQEARVVATMVGHTDRVNCVRWLPFTGESCNPTIISLHLRKPTAISSQVQVLAYLLWSHLGQLTIMSSSG